MDLAWLIYLGLVLKAAGFLVREELTLRVLVSCGIGCDLIFYALQTPPIIPSTVSNGFLLLINVVIVGIILWERTTLGMSRREREVFRHFKTMTPGQFRVLLRIADFHVVSSDMTLVRRGQKLDALFFVESGPVMIEKGDLSGQLQAPAFIGEIAFLKDRDASASVMLSSGARYIRWPLESLRPVLQRRPRLNNALTSTLANDLAGKVAESLPMEQTSIN